MSTASGKHPHDRPPRARLGCPIDHATGQLLTFVVRYRGRLAWGLSCAAFTSGVTLAAPWVLKNAVDDLTAGVTTAKLLLHGGLLLGIALVGGALRLAARRILIGMSRAVEYDIRNAFFARLQALPLAWFHARRTGDLMSRATNDLSAVRMMLGPAVMYATSTGLTFVIGVAFMASIHLPLTLLALLPLPLVTLASRRFGRAIHDRFERVQAQLSDISAVAQEALAGVRVIRAYRQEGRTLDAFRAANHEFVERNRGLIRLQGLFYPSLGLLMGLAELIVLWMGARLVVSGSLSVGELVAFNAYLAMLAWPMIAFGWVTNLLQRGRASWVRMLEVLETEPAIHDAAAGRADVRPDDIAGRIELRHLTFGYGERPVLHDVSLTVAPGQTVAIVGRTGSGKTTLLSLLARLHDPPPGTVFVDGVDVRDLRLATLRGAIGFVPQEPFLFSATIEDNVAFGGELSPARVQEVAEIARLARDVADFPQGYRTRVGERGITLSGGQKQRTALARALYVDPRILILDDAMSAVDTHTEQEILEGLAGFRRGRTTLIVSHRVSTVRHADHIVVIDGGRVVESGTHDALVEHGGIYAELHRRQQLQEQLAAS